MDFFGPRFSILLRTTTLNQQQVSNVKVDLYIISAQKYVSCADVFYMLRHR